MVYTAWQIFQEMIWSVIVPSMSCFYPPPPICLILSQSYRCEVRPPLFTRLPVYQCTSLFHHLLESFFWGIQNPAGSAWPWLWVLIFKIFHNIYLSDFPTPPTRIPFENNISIILPLQERTFPTNRHMVLFVCSPDTST
jgi:hypothetical protein